jgi:hypothetical protein
MTCNTIAVRQGRNQLLKLFVYRANLKLFVYRANFYNDHQIGIFLIWK